MQLQTNVSTLPKGENHTDCMYTFISTAAGPRVHKEDGEWGQTSHHAEIVIVFIVAVESPIRDSKVSNTPTFTSTRHVQHKSSTRSVVAEDTGTIDNI